MKTQNYPKQMYIFSYRKLNGNVVKYSERECKRPKQTNDFKELMIMLEEESVKSIIWEPKIK